MAKNPYEWIYERQSQPLKDYVLDEVTKILAKAAEEFPPSIEDWEREDLRLRFEPLLRTMSGRPERKVLKVAIELYKFELERDVTAIDDYMRNERWAEEGLTAQEREQAIFLWQFWTNQTLAFKDYVGSKFKWSELRALGDRLERHLLESASPLRQ